MALPSTGELALTDIQTEFGGGNPIGLSEYYAGGLYVPSGTTGDGGAIPTTGEITIGDFYGSQAGTTVTVTEGSDSIIPVQGTGNAQLYGYMSRNYLPDNAATSFINPAYTINFGSRSPTTVSGITIAGLFWSSNKWAQPRFVFVVVGTHAQTAFTSLNIQGYGVVTTAAADIFGSGIPGTGVTGTVWEWYISPTGWNGAGTSTVHIS